MDNYKSVLFVDSFHHTESIPCTVFIAYVQVVQVLLFVCTGSVVVCKSQKALGQEFNPQFR